jgi:hypothetical protein
MRTLLALLLAAPSFGAIAFVQGTGKTTGDLPFCGVTPGPASACSLAFLSNMAVNHLIHVNVGCNDCDGSTVTITDTLSSSYTQYATKKHGTVNFNAYSFWAVAPSSGADTVTVHFSPDASWVVMTIAEYSGTDISAPFDTSATGSGASLAPSTGNIVTSVADSVVICGTQYWASVTTPTAGSGYQPRVTVGSADSAFLQDKIVSATGTFTCDSTFTTASNNNWIAIGGAFKAGTFSAPRHRVIY